MSGTDDMMADGWGGLVDFATVLVLLFSSVVL